MIELDRALGHGHAVAVAVGDPDEAALAELHPDERARARALGPVRRREWVAGRRALRRALAAIEPDPAGALAPAPLLADERGRPLVPPGRVGSISHKRAVAVALAAAERGWTVGVDVELVAPRRIDVSARVLTPAERAAVPAAPGLARDRAVILAFALKEAIYKAIDPHLARYVGFQEVAVWPAPDGSVGVEPLAPWGLTVEAAWLALGEHVVCTARARRARRG
ncbi:MAG: 4'-phosphopantetheinyl transferase superfamily protein [Kofleriaceae bacterium]|nr:4'-phosphopantetheinyl transferase superfamily protein [Kofleriaceae bacterium]